ncbi:hematopoietic prostaglandin D synthase-like [Ptychodera flava]|uniref:hematopoietic prostaglandin D synthase-like n=1 Tax=Ptychodera flava TaxID=63121 RepID=UPI00396A7B6C
MPKYKLTYLVFRGRGEVIRLLFAAAGVEFEDVRVTLKDWPAVKEADPERKRILFNQLPILEFDGHVLAQSHAIARYVANEFGFAGNTNLEKAKVDMIVSALEDVYSQLGINVFAEKDKARKEAWFTEFRETLLPKSLAALEKLLTANGGGDGYFVGDSVTFADIMFADRVDLLVFHSSPDVLDGYPKLKALKSRVEALPKIAEWIKKRPYAPDFEYH